jgi:hypothetical protein
VQDKLDVPLPVQACGFEEVYAFECNQFLLSARACAMDLAAFDPVVMSQIRGTVLENDDRGRLVRRLQLCRRLHESSRLQGQSLLAREA